jgi:hypothetical protein
VKEAGAVQRRQFVVRKAGYPARLQRKVGHAARVPRHPRRLHVDEISHRLEHGIEIIAAHEA